MALSDILVRHPSASELIISRVFDAPRQLVFQAWTEPKHVMAWWGPSGFENTECAMDFRVGGSFRLLMRGPDGNMYPCHGTFQEIVVPERITYLGIAEDGHPCGAGLPPRALVTVRFDEEEGGKTRLTIDTQLESAAAKQAAADAGYIVGWSDSLLRLNQHLGIQ